MNTIILNGEMNLTYPDGFHVLTEEEMDQLNFVQRGSGECLSDPEQHILISIGWRSAKGFSFLFLKPEEIAHHDEQLIMKKMRDYGYAAEGFSSREIGGEKAHGFRYSYESQGIRMTAETIVLKHNKAFYYFHFYTREGLKQENNLAWEAILRTVSFQNPKG